MEDRIKEILLELDKEAEDHPFGFTSSGRRHFAHILYDALPHKERAGFENTRVKEYVGKYHEKIMESEARYISNLNREISEVLNDFLDPKSGKRQEARKELYARFPSQHWKIQLKILDAMVEVGTLADITWVVGQAQKTFRHQLFIIRHDNEKWYNSFLENLHQGCRKYMSHPKIATYIVETAEEKFIRENQEDLENAVGYHKVALALAKLDRDYKIDRDKLNFFQYLDILAQTDRPIRKAELWQEFIVWLLAFDDLYMDWMKKYTDSMTPYDSSLSLLDIRQVAWMVRSCEKMQLFDIVCSIYDLDNNIRSLADIIPMKHYDSDIAQKNIREFLKIAKTIAWEYEPVLQPDVTADDKLQDAMDNIGVKSENLCGIFTVTYEGEEIRIVVDKQTNNYHFESTLATAPTMKKEQLDSDVALINKESSRNFTGELTDEGSIIRSETFYVRHEGVFRLMFKSELRSFCFYLKLIKKLLLEGHQP